MPPLDVDNLSLVLREPARVLGVGFESDDLISHIVKSAEDQPGALLLLADLFTDLWERRGDGTLRVSDRRDHPGRCGALKACRSVPRANPDKVKASSGCSRCVSPTCRAKASRCRARWEGDEKGEVNQAVNAEWALVELLAGPDWRLLVTGEKDGKEATSEFDDAIACPRSLRSSA